MATSTQTLTDEVVLGVEVPPGVVEDRRHLPAHVELHCLTLWGGGGRAGTCSHIQQETPHTPARLEARADPAAPQALTLSTGSMRKSLKRYHCWCVTPWQETLHQGPSPTGEGNDSSTSLLGKEGCDNAMWELPPFLRHCGETPTGLGGDERTRSSRAWTGTPWRCNR